MMRPSQVVGLVLYLGAGLVVHSPVFRVGVAHPRCGAHRRRHSEWHAGEIVNGYLDDELAAGYFPEGFLCRRCWPETAAA